MDIAVSASDKKQKTRFQTWLLILACLFISISATILTISPVVRTHGGSQDFLWQHWIGVCVWLITNIFSTYFLRKNFSGINPFIFPILAILTGWGILTIYRLSPSLGLRQTLWFFIGISMLLAGLKINNITGFLRKYKYLWLSFGLLLTLLTLILGVNPFGNGPRLWLSFGNIYFQPTEPLKLLLIIYLAAFFADFNPSESQFLRAIFPTLTIAALILVILVAQRDLGTAAILMIIYSVMLMLTTHKRRLLWIIPLLFIITGIVAYLSISVVKVRVDTWLNPWLNTEGSSFQIIQSLIAISEGGVLGSGLGLGSPGLVPVAVSDFIFAAIAEESGLLGTSALLLLLLLLISQSLLISLRANSTFHRYLALGISIYFAAQSILIIGGNLGILPLTGVTLPFLSYGGSSLLTNVFAVLLLLEISHLKKDTVPLPTKKEPYIGLILTLLIIFSIVILVNSFIVLIQNKELESRSENSRWSINDRYVPLGAIVDFNNDLIVSTFGDYGTFSRNIHHIPLSNTIGYTNSIFGQTGLESFLYPYLRGLEGIPYHSIWMNELLYNQPPTGLDVKLTINLTLQDEVDQLFGDNHGAAILINAKTGEIYALASHPFFDSSRIEEDWDALISNQNSPLVNRVTQGAYSLGTASSPILLTGLLRNELSDFLSSYVSVVFDPICRESKSFNSSTFPTIQLGCNKANLQLQSNLSADALLETFKDFGFFSPVDFQLPLLKLDESYRNGLNLQQAIAEDSLLVSPLQMARMAAVLTSGGTLSTPTIINSYKTQEGNWITFPAPDHEQSRISSEVSEQVMKLLRAGESPYWYNLGHSKNSDNQVTTWFVGGTLPEWQGSSLAIAIVLEDNDPLLAREIAELLLLGLR